MILKGSQRAGAANLSAHLLNEQDNDHVTVYELRGFVGRDLHAALAEAHAISKGTKCTQYLFSLSLSPPKEVEAGEQDLVDAAERAEQALGLDGQPRAIVFHEKNGRRHAHVVWSRIDAKSMTAINMAHFKTKLTSLSRELYLDHGWTMPDGLRADGGKSPLNFTLDEWQQAKRFKLDPREIKQSFIEAWQRSDDVRSFEHALEERGYFLARGDRRGFVAVNIDGEVFSVPRMIGIKTREVKARLGDPDMLRSVDGTKSMIASRMTDQLQSYVDEVNARHEQEFEPLKAERDAMVANHREERLRLKDRQAERWKAESAERSARLNKGLRGLWDHLTGSASKIKRRNESEAWQALERDQKQRDDLILAQLDERRALQERMDALHRKHTQNRKILVKEISLYMRDQERDIELDRDENRRTIERQRKLDREFRR